MAETEDELARLDEAWDEEPAASRVEIGIPLSTAPDLGDLDEGWGEASGLAKPPTAKAPVPVHLGATKRQRREFEKQQRRQAQQRHAERKRARKQARREEAKQHASERWEVPIGPAAKAKKVRKAAGETRPPSREGAAGQAASRPRPAHDSVPDTVRPRTEPLPLRTARPRNEQLDQRRPAGEQSARSIRPFARYLVPVGIVMAALIT